MVPDREAQFGLDFIRNNDHFARTWYQKNCFERYHLFKEKQYISLFNYKHWKPIRAIVYSNKAIPSQVTASLEADTNWYTRAHRKDTILMPLQHFCQKSKNIVHIFVFWQEV